jgi:hypothetical protein
MSDTLCGSWCDRPFRPRQRGGPSTAVFARFLAEILFFTVEAFVKFGGLGAHQGDDLGAITTALRRLAR